MSNTRLIFYNTKESYNTAINTDTSNFVSYLASHPEYAPDASDIWGLDPENQQGILVPNQEIMGLMPYWYNVALPAIAEIENEIWQQPLDENTQALDLTDPEIIDWINENNDELIYNSDYIPTPIVSPSLSAPSTPINSEVTDRIREQQRSSRTSATNPGPAFRVRVVDETLPLSYGYIDYGTTYLIIDLGEEAEWYFGVRGAGYRGSYSYEFEKYELYQWSLDWGDPNQHDTMFTTSNRNRTGAKGTITPPQHVTYFPHQDIYNNKHLYSKEGTYVATVTYSYLKKPDVVYTRKCTIEVIGPSNPVVGWTAGQMQHGCYYSENGNAIPITKKQYYYYSWECPKWKDADTFGVNPRDGCGVPWYQEAGGNSYGTRTAPQNYTNETYWYDETWVV